MRRSGGTLTADAEPTRDRADLLPPRHEHVLDFERMWWRHAGAKEDAIRTEFGLSAARYYQLLNTVIDSPGAVRRDPMLVRRLQRARDARTATRAARLFTRTDAASTPHERPED